MLFISKIQSGYKNITYHNKTHGADLSCTAYYYLTRCGFLEKAKLDDIEFASIIIGGACHDHEHPGVNNAYLIDARDDIAIKYNDVSVLENHHVASTFAIIQQEKYNIFQNFDRPDYKKMRARMIGNILATDMAKHFAELGKFKTRTVSNDFDPAGADKELSMHMVFHLSDISNPAKKFDLCSKWTELLYVEFFMQGDLERERELPISYLMDRCTVNIAKAQVGFIDVIIMPAYQALAVMLPLVNENVQIIESNKERWATLVDQYEERTNAEKVKFEAS